MNCAEGSLSELCKKGQIDELLKSYIEFCSTSYQADGAQSTCSDSAPSAQPKKSGKHLAPVKVSFPNIAGFCRYLGVSTCELDALASEYPSEHGKILTVLEDEALNSGLSATLLSAYLKKRLGYDVPSKNALPASQLEICFEHDILEDGE